MSLPAPTALDVRSAAVRITGFTHRTPVLTSRGLNETTGLECHLKCDNFQRSGSFKLRGATNFIQQIPDEEKSRGVVAFSSGNHAQAVAYASRVAGIKATIIMPSDAPKTKLFNTRDMGANVITYDRLTENREAIGKTISADSGATLIPPYDHPWTIAGQGTLALELLEEVPNLDALLVCLGGGGLLSGCALIAKEINPAIRVFGVEPALANDYALSLKAGKPVRVDNSPTIADGLRTPQPGEITFPIIQHLVEDVLLVSEEEIYAAMRYSLTRLKIVAEPSGVVCIAAAMAGKVPAGIKRVGIVVSGGNMDLDLIATLA
ncbi:MAG: pyridoxal-phosphate dependent enzyme [Acidobacteria bacterium]|nr:pyridoxal-phosphate dependent enzyme [Acidobacteriota bacterium]